MIIVHAKGDSSIGIGNLSRCYELVNKLSPTTQIRGIFECEKELFQRYNHHNIVRSESYNHSIELLLHQNISLYICDLLTPNKQLSNLLHHSIGTKILHFNGIENGFEPDHLLVTHGFKYDVVNPFGEIHKGFEYYIVPQKCRISRPSFFKKKSKIKNILICFGGADPALYSDFFANIINDPIYVYTLVLGPAMPPNRKNKIKQVYKEQLTIIDSPSDMVSLIKNHDFLVTLGGMMTYEAMTLGTPVGIIRWSYLSFFAKSFNNMRMAYDLGELVDAYDNLRCLDVPTVNLFAQNAFQIIDGKALDHLVNLIESITGQHEKEEN